MQDQNFEPPSQQETANLKNQNSSYRENPNFSINLMTYKSQNDPFKTPENYYALENGLGNKQILQQIKQQGEINLILSNLLFLIIKEAEQNQIQQFQNPVPLIYTYISSQLHAKNKEKERVKMICSRKGWPEYQLIENELQKLQSVCDVHESLSMRKGTNIGDIKLQMKLQDTYNEIYDSEKREEKLNEKKSEKQKEWKNLIRIQILEMSYLVKPQNGLFSNYININSQLNSYIIQPDYSKKISVYTILRINQYKEIFQFLKLTFSFTRNYSCLINEEIVAFYIKYSFFSFVKLYSHSHINELNEIQQKIQDLSQKSKAQAQQKYNYQEQKEKFDKNLNNQQKQFIELQQSKYEKHYKFFKILFLNLYTNILFSISTVRTDQITHIFYNYRIMHFFTKEIDLEFDINQIRKRFLDVKKQNMDKKKESQQYQSQNHSQKQFNQCQNDQNFEQQNKNIHPQVNKQNFTLDLGKLDKIQNEKSSDQNQQEQKPKQQKKNSFQLNLNLQQVQNRENTSPRNQQQKQLQQNLNLNNVNQQMVQMQDLNQEQQKICSNNNNYENNDDSFEMYNYQEEQQYMQYLQNQSDKKNQQYQNQNNSNKMSFNLNLQAIQNNGSNQNQDKYQNFSNNEQQKVPSFNLNLDGLNNSNVNNQQEGGSQYYLQNNQNLNQNETYNQFNNFDNDQSAQQQFQNFEPNSFINNQEQRYMQNQDFSISNNNIDDNQDVQQENYSDQNLKNNYVEFQNRQNLNLNLDVLKNEGDKNQNQIFEENCTAQDNFNNENSINNQKSRKQFNLQLNLNKISNIQAFQNEEENQQNAQIQQNYDQEQAQLDTFQKQNHSQNIAENKSRKNSQISFQQNQQDDIKINTNLKNLDIKNKKDQQQDSLTYYNFYTNKKNNFQSVEDEILNENIFYYSERRIRKIYSDKELHASVVALIISLLLTPQRGTFDDTYCSQNPVQDGKVNILYLLHFHLNHPSNQYILPLLLQKISYIKPYPSGQRLIKLLCSSFSDFSIYKKWEKINAGAFGTIFSSQVQLATPFEVAIKQMSIPKQIFDRCVIYDIFSEITCLENFRLDPCVTDLYDYGVTESDYIIVMKKYQQSLKQWRKQQKGDWQENLITYLTIYREILKSVQLLHSNNVTHYDIKADNILLEIKEEKDGKKNIRIVLGDFGSCKLFKNEDDEYDLQSRGTEYIQSPEMLTLTIKRKRESDTYDRRKKVGTNRASDIWSLGCLLYEILTGDFLFQKPNWQWPDFFFHLTDVSKTLLEPEMLQKIGNNTYLTDFLNFVFVRQQNIRPNIDSVIKRFEPVYSIFLSQANESPSRNLPLQFVCKNTGKNIHNYLNIDIPAEWDFETVLNSYQALICYGYVDYKGFQQQFKYNSQQPSPLKQHSPLMRQFPQMSKKIIKNCKKAPSLLKIMEEIYLSNQSYFIKNKEKLIQIGITHIVTESGLVDISNLERFQYLLIQKDQQNEQNDIQTATFKLAAKFLDQLHKSQCICGCTTLILKKNYNQEKKIPTRTCSCSNKRKNGNYDCPSGQCQEYLDFIKKRYKLSWETIKWGFLSPNQFLIGPFNSGLISDDEQIQLILNSEGPAKNCIPHEKMNENQNQDNIFDMQDMWTIYKQVDMVQ
ncbi:Protein kinase-like domain [Pseudocohnilembus persalinus]|uniref:Protein kinase-like domain n=1 Tax=Pseudocohnilembus persalinus TaxID=266149 RepID=A0A0V0QCC2_PSEPJ|nr:Protein kinase-like domain [Pseudocohnilembus persalinus]|eukprot:KRW99809.1 Protein kinase-like domain [Pseudocohnilembus persalinus]